MTLLQFRTHKIIYRRYAGLFFSLCVDITDNELAYLECIHLFVEILDHFFSNVCELDLVFNFHKVSCLRWMFCSMRFVGSYFCKRRLKYEISWYRQASFIIGRYVSLSNLCDENLLFLFIKLFQKFNFVYQTNLIMMKFPRFKLVYTVPFILLILVSLWRFISYLMSSFLLESFRKQARRYVHIFGYLLVYCFWTMADSYETCHSFSSTALTEQLFFPNLHMCDLILCGRQTSVPLFYI